MTRVLALGLIGTIAASIGVVPARAADGIVLAGSGLFLPNRLDLEQGSTLTLVNVDAAEHNITSTRTGRDGEPRFSSDTLGPGEIGTVDGVSKLKPGAYAFFCTLHEYQRGLLLIAG
ncbi:MAG TPA: cupredoxin domain-containing protein [Actinomycetota bacterium]|nr:cupredoxin domain-containing protein [Actinomycetota bacterium]